ncbi:MAG: PaaI family thioesterase [Spirochaetia bacterium]|nr:PaaI family thioesterase [Spirochaetia bacterium]
MKNLEEYRKLFHDRFGQHIGCEMLEITQEYCVYRLDAKEHHWNPNKVTHGGAIFSAMDSCQGAFVHYLLDLSTSFGTTAEATIRYKKPHLVGPLTIRTTLRDRKRNLLFVETSAQNSEGEVVAVLSEKWMVLSSRGRSSPGGAAE